MEAVARGTGPLGTRGLSALRESEDIRLKPRKLMSADQVIAADTRLMMQMRSGLTSNG